MNRIKIKLNVTAVYLCSLDFLYIRQHIETNW